MPFNPEFESVNSEVMRHLADIFGTDDPQLLIECRNQLWELAMTSEREPEPESSRVVLDVQSRRVTFKTLDRTLEPPRAEPEKQKDNGSHGKIETDAISPNAQTRRVAFRNSSHLAETCSVNEAN